MNARVQVLNYALWFLQLAMQVALVVIIFKRRLPKNFPVFLSYNAFQILMSVVLFPISLWGSYFYYFYTYWYAAAVSLALGFSVIHEVFLDIFRPYHTLKDLGTVVFKWAGLVMLMVAAVVAAASTAADQGPLVQAVLTVQRCVRVVQCGLVIFLLLFARYLGVSRKQQSFGIAMGFGAFALVELMAAALRAGDAITESHSNLAVSFVYDLTVIAWFGYLWYKPAKREAAENLLTSQRWEESLNDLQYPDASPDSLIPMFEGMVERALSTSPDAFDPAKLTAPPEGMSLIESLGELTVPKPPAREEAPSPAKEDSPKR